MKKIIIALAAIVLMASCQKSIYQKMDLVGKGVLSFQTNSSGEISSFMEQSGPVTFTIAASKKMTADTQVNFEVVRDSSEALAAFNKSNGTNYWLMPEENYEFEDEVATIKAGSAVSEPVTVNIDIDGFKNGVIYCIPLKITGSSAGMNAVPGIEYAFITVRGYVYASAASLPGGSYFSMPKTKNDPNLELEVCTMEIRVKVNDWCYSEPYISTVIGVEENFLLRFGDVSCPKDKLQLSGQGVSITSKNSFERNKWYHIAVVANGIRQTCKLYINGELDSEQAMGGKGINLGKVYNTVFSIGMSVNTGRCLNGYVSEGRVWGRELSAIELVNGQCSIADPVGEARDNKLLGYWKLDAENKGKDLTGNGYDGDAHGSVSYTPANIRCPE